MSRQIKSKTTAGALTSSGKVGAGIQAAVAKGYFVVDNEAGTVISLSGNLLQKSISNSQIIAVANVPKKNNGMLLPTKQGDQNKQTGGAVVLHEPCNIVMVSGDTLVGLQHAWQLSKQNQRQLVAGSFDPAVLVFASDTNPGGSRTSSNFGTQEEALCRTTTLRLAQVALDYPIPTKGVAYIPHVQALIDPTPPKHNNIPGRGVNGKNGTNSSKSQSALTFTAICGALRSCVSGSSPSVKEKSFLTDKICGILNQACVHGHRRLVLGAWGCRAFGNPVEWVARTFRNCLGMERYQGCFDLVIFAIPNKSMLSVFEEHFSCES